VTERNRAEQARTRRSGYDCGVSWPQPAEGNKHRAGRGSSIADHGVPRSGTGDAKPTPNGDAKTAPNRGRQHGCDPVQVRGSTVRRARSSTDRALAPAARG
jgi:hypothetical protein